MGGRPVQKNKRSAEGKVTEKRHASQPVATKNTAKSGTLHWPILDKALSFDNEELKPFLADCQEGRLARARLDAPAALKGFDRRQKLLSD